MSVTDVPNYVPDLKRAAALLNAANAMGLSPMSPCVCRLVLVNGYDENEKRDDLQGCILRCMFQVSTGLASYAEIISLDTLCRVCDFGLEPAWDVGGDDMDRHYKILMDSARDSAESGDDE